MDRKHPTPAPFQQALRIAVIYMVVGCLWIILSDKAVEILFPTPELASVAQTFKGWFYVLVTGGLVFHLVYRLLRHEYKARLALTESRQLLSQALEAGRLFPWTLHLDGYRVSFPPSLLVELGYGGEETSSIERDWKRLVHANDLPQFLARINAHLQGKSEYCNVQFRLKTKDGHYVWMQAHGQVIEADAYGNAVRMAGTLHDITLLKLHEKDMLRARNMAEDAHHAKTAFIADISREIRAPLNEVVDKLLLMDQAGLNTEQRRYITEAIKMGTELVGMLNEVILYSKLASGTTDWNTEKIIVADLLQDVESVMAAKCRSKGTTLTFAITQDTPAVFRGDYEKIRLTLIKLIEHAHRRTENGSILLTVSHPSPNQINTRSILLFTVEDTGKPIPDSSLRVLFTPFSAADQGQVGQMFRMDLGLRILQRLVRLLNGALCVSSTKVSGTMFLLTVPVIMLHKETKD